MMRLKHDLEARRPYLVQDFSDAEYERRLAAMRAGMAKEKLDALIIYCGAGSYAPARWLTNYQPIYGSVFVALRADGGLTVTTDGDAACRAHAFDGLDLPRRRFALRRRTALWWGARRGGDPRSRCRRRSLRMSD